jgi:hypothetical protein
LHEQSRVCAKSVKRRQLHLTGSPAWGILANDRSSEDTVMQFMVIETFRNQDAKAVYGRFRDKGRMMPEGLTFVASWVAADLSRCFQIMECDSVAILQRWVVEWSDLVEFEIVPVVAGSETAATLADALPEPSEP